MLTAGTRVRKNEEIIDEPGAKSFPGRLVASATPRQASQKREGLTVEAQERLDNPASYFFGGRSSRSI